MQKNTDLNQRKIVIDATNTILGRLSTQVAKQLLEGKTVKIVNCEKAVISGKKHSILKEYRERHTIHTASNPTRGPFHQKRPDRFVRRTIRGMLPYKKSSGRDAYKRLRVYIGVPDEFEGKETTKLKDADASKLRCKYISIGNLCREFGWE